MNDELRVLYDEKLNALNVLLKYIQGKILGETEADVERFVIYAKRKQELLDDVSAADKKIKQLITDADRKEALSAEAECQSLLMSIYELDSKNHEKMIRLKDKLSTEIKSVKMGRKLANYQNISSFEGGYRFDSKK